METSQDTRSLALTLAVYVLILVAKLAAYWASGVLALLAEALHTLSDIFISGFLLVAALYSRRRADATHMFGYGRAQNVAALVAAVLFISFTSFELYREAIPRLLRPEAAPYENLPLALGVILGSMAAAALPLVKLLLQRVRGAAAKAQLLELINDQLGLLAALAAVLAIRWGYPIADPIASIAVATLIAANAIKLFGENASLLLGRSPGPEFVARIESIARSVPGVVAVRDLRAEYIGPDTVHAGMRVAVAPDLPVTESARIAREIETRVHEGTHAGYCFIQIEPAVPGAGADRQASRAAAT
ncbi:MAG: cation transporter [Burkholderiales bacterium]|nr:cation transporter [Burkholderiales bacterium]